MDTPDSTAISVKDEQAPQVKRFGVLSDPLIFYGSLIFIGAFVVITIALGETARESFTTVAQGLMEYLGWMYIGGVSLIFIFLVGIFVSRYGRLRLGDDDEEAEHSLIAWFCMLFAAGIGAVLMFWGVAEPLYHSVQPPQAQLDPMSEAAIEEAFGFTFYHFGIHMWAILALPGLALGYFIYKRKLPPRVSSVFSPLLGGNIYRWPGKLIDILAIIATIFGIAVSVGLGVLQINAGMNYLWGVPQVSWVQLLIIMVITGTACISVATGLEKGIKTLSNVNILLAVLLMCFIIITGPTLVLMRFSVEAFGIYASYLPELMFWTDAFDDNPGWQGSWTVFYWAWTICWSPFVGMFVARISRGRTVREYIGGVLALPAIFSVIWFSVFGRAGIDIEANDPGALSGPVVDEGNTPYALFGFLEHFPMATAVSILALVVVIIFFITSIDSAGMVMDMFATGAENVTPTWYRVLWACAIGAVTAALLLISPDTGIATLQEVVIIVGLPFFITQAIMMYSLLKGMSDDAAAERRIRTRQWEVTDTAEKLEEHEAMPAPEPPAEFGVAGLHQNEEGALVISGDVVIDGDLGVTGDVVDEEAYNEVQDSGQTKIVEQQRPKSKDDWEE
ncbi:MAG: BCCT family transporter [Corynebacterium sp.]|nr:BCCT family transporter [Corynebacterium sp.]